MTRGGALVSEFLIEEPPPVVDWLAENITLPRSLSPAKPGKFSVRTRPYQKEVFDCFHPHAGINDAVIVAGTQVLKTFGLLLGMAYRARWVPNPKLVAVPSMRFAEKKIVAPRWLPLIDDNPVLSELKPANSDHYTLSEQRLTTGAVNWAGSGSATNLSSITVGDVYQDECCKFAGETSEEGHPMHLADERAKEFQQLAFRYKSSSPTTFEHPFWGEYLLGTQTAILVPCPNCQELFEFKHYNEGNYESLKWDKTARDKSGLWIEDKVRDSARYHCPVCDYPIQDHEKPGMIQRYETENRNPTAKGTRKSFKISSFYSDSITFGEMVWKYLTASNDLIDGLRNYHNSWLAEPYADYEVKVDDDKIEKLKGEYVRGTIPRAPLYVLLTADPGEVSGCHWVAQAIYPNGGLAVIDWGVVLGPEDLLQLQRSLRYKVNNSDRVLSPVAGLTDSRYDTAKVYKVCMESGGFWQPTRGTGDRIGSWQSSPVTSHPGLNVITFVDHNLKTELYGRRIGQGNLPRVEIPADADGALIKGLSGQELETRTGKWKRLPNDHFGDCVKQGVLSFEIRRTLEALSEGS